MGNFKIVGLTTKIAEVMEDAEVAVLKRDVRCNQFLKENGDCITNKFIISRIDLLFKIYQFLVEEKFQKHESTRNGIHGSKILKYTCSINDFGKTREIEPIIPAIKSFFLKNKIPEGYFPEDTYSFESYDEYNESIIECIRKLIDDGLVQMANDFGNKTAKKVEDQRR